MNSWTHFWQRENKPSSFSAPGQIFGYPEELVRYWENIIDTWPKHSSVLDLCCGRGALTYVIARRNRDENLGFNIEGIDGANIDNNNTDLEVELRGLTPEISFLYGTEIEKLPHKNEVFDVLVSQFGVEYSDTDKSLSEASRVLKDGGNFSFIHHSISSEISKDSIAGINCIEKVFQSNLFLEIYKSIQSQTTDTDPANSLSLLNSLKFEKREAAWFSDISKSFNHIFTCDKSEAIHLLDSLATNLEETVKRLVDQINAAKRAEKIVEIAKSYDFLIEREEPIYIKGDYFGNYVSMRKNRRD